MRLMPYRLVVSLPCPILCNRHPVSLPYTRMESLLAINILCLGSQLSLPVLTLLHSLATSPSTTSHPPPTSPLHHRHNPHLPLSTPHSSPSLLRDTPTEKGSQISTDTSPSRDDHTQNSLPAKKGTRFILPGAADTGSLGGLLTPELPPVTTSGKHRGQVDTLNVLGQQPGFREPYPESICSEPTGLEESSTIVGALPTPRPRGERGDLEDCHPGSHTRQHMEQELGSGSYLEEGSTSQSLIIPSSSPWLKSSTSKNFEWYGDVTQGDGCPSTQG